MSATDETNTRVSLARPPLSVVDVGECFRASPPVTLPRRRSAPPRRPARLLPPASSRQFFPPSVSTTPLRDRVWIPAVLVAVIMMGAIGSSVHTDLTANLQPNHEPIAHVDTRIETGATAPQPSRVAQENTRPDLADASDRASALHSIAVPPLAATPPDVAQLPVAPPTPEVAPPTPFASPVVIDRAAGPTKHAAAAILAPPPAIDQPFAPLVFDNLAHVAASTSIPRSPSPPAATESRRAPSESAGSPPPRIASAAMSTSFPKKNPKGRVGKQRASLKRATVAEVDIDPDAPPRTWDGIARLQLLRTAP